MNRPASAKEVLKKIFGYSSFRENQEQIIKALLNGQDVFTAMPTGGGKSLCYQIPGILLSGLTLVVSPLIALMKDQVDEASAKGIPAAFLNSTLSSKEVSSIYARLYRAEIKLLYISPERLAVDGYIDHVKELNVSFVAVDEAHCLSEWGHDFRPDYLFLSKIRAALPDVPIAAFTATATDRVQRDIIRILNLHNPFIVRASFNRKELFYEVQPKKDVLTQIADFILERPGKMGIVYRISRNDVETTAAFLASRGIKALPYHAGMSKEQRARNQEDFDHDEVQAVVATIAFGMGINKSNIRFIIHGDLPKSMEGYYQETGRAGRDGLASDCLLLFSTGDIARQQYFIEQIEDPTEQERTRSNLNRMIRFATVHLCRRKQILDYFGEAHPENCGNCDICSGSRKEINASVDAQKILSAIARVNESFGINHIIEIVRGADTEKIRAKGHQYLPTYGVGNDKSLKWWRGIISELIGQEKIVQDNEHYNVLRLTDAGKDVLFGRDKFFISELTAELGKKTSGKTILRKKESTEKVFSPAESELFEKLKQVRIRLAKKHRLPPYIIFTDRTLTEMAKIKPQNPKELLEITGVGEKKLQSYGKQFLSVLREPVDDS